MYYHQIGGGTKRSRILNRLFPWRTSSPNRSQPSATRLMLPPESSGSSMRRTSPVDLHLGEATAPTTIPAQQAEKEESEELGTLRLLATELHTALRLSEEENLLLKGYNYKNEIIRGSP